MSQLAFPDRLPAVQFVNPDPETVREAVIGGFERATGQTLYPGNPERLFLEGLAYLIAVLSENVDNAGRQTFLAFAEGPHLDHLGAEADTPRLGLEAATTRLRFSLDEALPWPVEILGGTRAATADQKVFFLTDQYAVIEPGQTFVEVPATAMRAGAEANGLLPGQVNRLVDVPAYVSGVRNVTITQAGADPEEDESYRLRIHGAREAYSCAGPVGAYAYHVRRVHREIADPGIYSPVPGTVCICPLMRGGELPDEAILEAIRAILSADDVRPLTDTVIVRAPEVVPFPLSVGWYLHRKDASLAGSIGARVSQAVRDFAVWQSEKPGRDINPDELTARLIQAGAKRLSISSPSFMRLEPWQVGRVSDLDVRYLGEEDD